MKKILCVILTGLVIMNSIASVGCAEKKTIPYNKPRMTVQNYTIHSPIHILGNAQFIGANGVVSGSGIQNDPYIIEGWEIKTLTNDGIFIENSNAYFIIKNCYVHLSETTYQRHGIYFNNVTNGIIQQCLCMETYNGIFIDSSKHNRIMNNSFIGCYRDSVKLVSSNNNTISNNTFTSTDWGGIHILQSNNNIISFNNVTGNNHLNYGIFSLTSILNLISSNSVSYYEYGILLTYSNMTRVFNNSVTNNIVGISLSGSKLNTISYNGAFKNTDNGIKTGTVNGPDQPSNYNTFSYNEVFQNGGKGISNSRFSCYNMYAHNKIYSNTEYGIELGTGNYCRILLNNFTNNNKGNIQANSPGGTNFFNTSGESQNYGNYWSDWISPDNNNDGIVDNPYDILYGAKDYYPIADWTKIPDPSPLPLIILLVILLVGITTRRNWL